MFEHADRNHLLELALQGAIIHQFKVDRQIRAALPGEWLLLGHGDPHHLHAVVGRRMVGQAAPAATDVQQAFARLQVQLATDQFEFVPLGVSQMIGVRPIGAGVTEAGSSMASKTSLPIS